MAADIIIPTRNLARNPLVAQLFAGTNATAKFKVWGGVGYATLIYEGLVSSIADYSHINISDLFTDLQKTAGVADFKIAFVNDTDVITIEKLFTVYGGAVSKLMQRKLAAAGTDIFGWKLKNNNANFLLTTRTNARTLYIPEDELMPLKYYSKDIAFKIWAGTYNVATIAANTGAEALAEIDLKALRLLALTNNNNLHNVFEIKTLTGGWICTVVITEKQQASDYYIKFLNSWGVYEKLSIDGVINYAPTFSEGTEVMKYDAVIADLTPSPNRKTITNLYTAEMGYRGADDKLFALDMLLSDNCYLVANGVEYAAKIKSDSSLWQSTDDVPTSIAITIQLLDVDENYSVLSDGVVEVLGTMANDYVQTNNEFNIAI